MKNKFFFFLYLFLITSTISAQKKLSYNSKGELSREEYHSLLKSKNYQAISAFDTVSIKPLLVYALYIKDKKKGILDDSGREVTPALYDGIEGLNISYTTVMFGFHENYPVKIGNKYGLITNTGKSILPVEYDYIYCEQKRNAKSAHKKAAVADSLIIATKGEETFYFSPKGKIFKQQPEESQSIKKGKNLDAPLAASKPKQPTTSHGKIIKKIDDDFGVVEARIDNKYYYQGLVEFATDKLILPITYTYLIPSQKGLLITIKDKKYNLYNTKGELALKETYEGIENFNKVYKIKKDGMTALFDLDLNQKTDFIYESFGTSGPDFMIARKEGKEGVINAEGVEVIPFMYEKIDAYLNRHGSGFAFFRVTQNKKQGFISTKGSALTEIVYDDIFPECTISEPSFSSEPLMPTDFDYDAKYNSFFIFKKDNKFGLLDNHFQPLIPNEHDYLKKSFQKDFVVVGNKNSNPGSYNLSLLNIKTNTTILPYEYNFFKYLGGDYFMIYQKNLMGVCNFKGEMIIPMQPCKDLSDSYYHSTIYRGLSQIDGRKSYYLIDYQGTQINLLGN